MTTGSQIPPEGEGSTEALVESQAEDTRPEPRRVVRPDDLATAVKRVMTNRGFSVADIASRVDAVHKGTWYRVVAGRTTDPWSSTIANFSEKMQSHPDEMLGIEDFESWLQRVDQEAYNEYRYAVGRFERGEISKEDLQLALDVVWAVINPRRRAAWQQEQQGSPRKGVIAQSA